MTLRTGQQIESIGLSDLLWVGAWLESQKDAAKTGWYQQLGEWWYHWEVLSPGTHWQATITHYLALPTGAACHWKLRPDARSHNLQKGPMTSYQQARSSSDVEPTLQKTSRSSTSKYNKKHTYQCQGQILLYPFQGQKEVALWSWEGSSSFPEKIWSQLPYQPINYLNPMKPWPWDLIKGQVPLEHKLLFSIPSLATE